LQELVSGAVAVCGVMAYRRGDQPDRLQCRDQRRGLDGRAVDVRRVKNQFVDGHVDT
jgi:hypothetical protein